jgi:hypothetical protein
MTTLTVGLGMLASWWVNLVESVKEVIETIERLAALDCILCDQAPHGSISKDGFAGANCPSWRDAVAIT